MVVGPSVWPVAQRCAVRDRQGWVPRGIAACGSYPCRVPRRRCARRVRATGAVVRAIVAVRSTVVASRVPWALDVLCLGEEERRGELTTDRRGPILTRKNGRLM